ncbi:MAG: hypothetical protein PHS98_04600 [Bacilli bacterium]|nr:hypothetical protein [Bacilli bacterium]
MAYAIVRTDNVQATKSGNIKSGKYVVGTTETAIENANLVKLDGLLSTSNREVFKCVSPGEVTDKDLYLVASPELIYDKSTTAGGALGNFRNAARDVITLIGLEKGDLFSVSDEAVVAVGDIPVVGNYVTNTKNSTKFTEKDTLAGTETFVGKVIARELFKKNVYLNVIQVISAN